MNRCLITGAAQGIGRALAERFARADFAILGVDVDARRAADAQRELFARGFDVEFQIADLAAKDDVDRLLAALGAGPPFDVVIHNAGINAVGPFASCDLEMSRRVIDVNLRAPMRLTAALLRDGRLADGGTIVFVSSLSHFVGYPGAAAYAASKDGLASYARSLAVALGPSGRNVLTAFPGPTRTGHARQHSPDNSREHRRMPPETLADATFAAVRRRRRRLVPGLANQAFAIFGRWFPRWSDALMRRAILDRLPTKR